ncbi:MAG: ATP-binding cassette domain-containing protein [Methanothrix sp.]|nr:ATP-binding cassette domain-containing protein [Methanothrix sp.]
MEAAISLRGLTKRFGALAAVDRIDLDIWKGELFGLLGPNGAGKSTIIKMLTTMLTPTAGQAMVWGHDVRSERDAVRASIGVVFQDPALDGMLTGRENLDFHGRMYGMDRPLRQRRIEEVLALVDLSDRADVKVEEYSGGMQRRLEIARGLMHRPHVLFLDEPTLGLDAQTRRHIWQYIRRMNRSEEVTIVLTTHYMEEADQLCDRVAIIDSGRIVALDRPEDLKDLIGADTITLEAQSGREELLESLRTLEWIRSATCTDGTISLMVDHAQSRIPEIMQHASRVNAVIRSVGMHEPTLEDVFLKFTGRKIRTEEAAGGIMAQMHRRRR